METSFDPSKLTINVSFDGYTIKYEGQEYNHIDDCPKHIAALIMLIDMFVIKSFHSDLLRYASKSSVEDNTENPVLRSVHMKPVGDKS